MLTFLERIKDDDFLFFDLDGTLFETDLANSLAYSEAVEKIAGLKINIGYHKNKRITKKRLVEIIPELSDNNYEEIIALKNQVYSKYISLTKINNNIANVLLNHNCKNTVLVSNCCMSRGEQILKHYGFYDLLAKKIYKDDFYGSEQNKYSHAIETIKANIEKIYVFENDLADIQDAINAGINKKNIWVSHV